MDHVELLKRIDELETEVRRLSSILEVEASERMRLEGLVSENEFVIGMVRRENAELKKQNQKKA